LTTTITTYTHTKTHKTQKHKHRTGIQNIISSRIGTDQFIEKLETLRRSPLFSLAEQGKVRKNNILKHNKFEIKATNKEE
jgi:hypothetical protein